MRTIAELASVDGKIDRYLTAFENGQLTSDQCGQRIDKLSVQASSCARCATSFKPPYSTCRPSQHPTNLKILRKYITETARLGDPAQVKQLINNLVAKVVVVDRDDIQPYFYLPAEAPGQALGEKVRPLYGLVPRRDTSLICARSSRLSIVVDLPVG